jgi:DNA-binding NtrC family response regulator
MHDGKTARQFASGPGVREKGVFLHEGAETILVVEDDDGLRILVHRILARLGYQVLTARDGHDALACSESHQGALDLILSDVVMPDLSGVEVVKRVQGRFTNAVVLFMSGHLDHALLKDGVLRNGTHFIQKPFTPDALATKVREVLDGSPPRIAAGRSSPT